MNERTSLTAEEKVTVAYFHLVRGLKQQDLAALYGINSGRIAEAVVAVREAVTKKGRVA